MKQRKVKTWVLLALFMCLASFMETRADISNWDPDKDRSITISVIVENDYMYVSSPMADTSCLIQIIMTGDTGTMYDFEVVASPNEPGVLSLHDLPTGIYDVVLTSDDGMATHGILSIGSPN